MAERQVNITPDNGVGSYTPITTKTTTLVKTGGGILKRIAINTAGSGSTTIAIYDALTATGTPIATIDPSVMRTIEYGLAFSTGLCIVTATGTAADITVVYS